MRRFEQWTDQGGHAETVAILEDVIATLEGVQTQHQVLLDKIYAECESAKWSRSVYRLNGLPALIQDLIEESA